MNENSNRGLKLISVISVIAFIVIWQLIVNWNIVPNTLLASPIQIFKLFVYKLTSADPDGAVLWVHVLTSLEEAVIGYALALVIGIPLGLLMGWFVLAEGFIRPIFEMIRPIPPVAWIPLTIFWFGIGLTGKVYIILISGIVPAVINSFVGVRMTNPTFIRMARTYGASDWQVFKNICIPSALPMVFGGLQLALAASWTSLVAAEMIASNKGLGFLITMGQRLADPSMILLGMVMIGLTGYLIGVVIDLVERKLQAGLRR
ncbi:ABC transporter permease [Desulfosporosinus sp. PR]|uniref:ABC transporter permease n=1 Tax=Candidatus Desulfosporosinus nitrosoreducens TaxID=3401928 RepID=UPI0027F31DD1|nr:ABC transporter permease [Desulfosporosinus sp. PR]MDQ7095264.1 ABC transporter permease [Desulfosporosinus sp. PR]